MLNLGWDTEIVIPQEMVADLYQQFKAQRDERQTLQSVIDTELFQFSEKDLEATTIRSKEDVDRAVQTGVSEPMSLNPTFLTTLLPEMVLFLVSKNPIDFSAATLELPFADLMFVPGLDREPTILAFSSTEELEKIKPQLPEEFSERVQVPARSILKKLPRGFGLVVNPDSEKMIPLPDRTLNMGGHFNELLLHRSMPNA